MAHNPPLATWANRTTFPSLRPANGPGGKNKSEPSFGEWVTPSHGLPAVPALEGPALRGASASAFPLPPRAGQEPGPCPEGVFPAALDGAVPAAHPRHRLDAASRPPCRQPGSAGCFSLFPACFPRGSHGLSPAGSPGRPGGQAAEPGGPRAGCPPAEPGSFPSLAAR